MKTIYLDGLGLWAPGFASVAAWVEGSRDSSVIRPPARLLDARIGRYTSLLTRMAVDVFDQATTAARLDPSTAGIVFGSAYGEVQIAFEQLDMIREDGLASPARFKNSVHNSAIGHISIATGNRGFSTAIAAGATTVAMSLLEAWNWLETNGGSAVVVVADEQLPPFLENVGVFNPIGIALVLRSSPVAGRSGVRLDRLVRRDGVPEARVPEGWRGNPAAHALGLVDAVIEGRSGTVPLGTGDDVWCVDVDGRRQT